MTVVARTDRVVELPTGGRWPIEVKVTDDDGCAADVAPVITVTSPSAVTTTPTVEDVGSGVYRGVVPSVASAGRWTARAVVADHGVADFVAYVTGPSTIPTLPEVLTYLGKAADNANNDAATALATELSAQRKVCWTEPYDDDLRGALFRRVARNLEIKNIPLAVVQKEGDPTFLPANDPEVRRLEAPFRKVFLR